MMLEKMTKGPAKIVGSILAALLIVAMAAWGIEDFLRRSGPGNSELAEVGSTKIDPREFDREFRNAINRLRTSLGPSMDAKRAREMGIADGILESMVDRRLIALEAQDLGLRVGDEVIREEISSTPAFQGLDNKFDQAIFRQTLAQSGISEAQFVRSLRDGLKRQYLVESIHAGSVAPKELVDARFKYAREKRTADIVFVPRSSVGDVGKPTEAELAEFHKKHASEFTAPEYRKISAIVLNPDEYAKGLKPSEERIKEEFQNRLGSLTTPEKRGLEQILLADEATAEKAEDLLKEGRSFASVAKEVAGKDEKALSLGDMTKHQLETIAPELAEAAFALKDKGVTAPIRTALGWHIVKVVSITPAKVPTLEEARKKIVADLNHEQAVEQLVDVASKIEDAIAGGANLKEAAERTGMKLLTPPPVDRAGRTESGKRAPNIPADPRFLQNAFQLDDGAIGQMEEIGVGGYFIVGVDKIIPPALRPLDKVKAEVEKAWKTEKQNEAAKKKASAIVDAVKGGTPLKDAAAREGLKVTAGKPIDRRGGGDDNIPRSLQEDLFKLKKGGTASGPTRNGFAVIQLTNIEDPDPVKSKDEVEQLKAALTGAIGNDLLEQFTLALKERFPVTIDRKALNAYLDRSTGVTQ